MKRRLHILAGLVVVAMATGCVFSTGGGGEAAGTTPAGTATPVASGSPSATATATVTSTGTATPAATSTATSTPGATPSPSPTAPPPGYVAVLLAQVPRGEHCAAGVPVAATVAGGDQSLDQQPTDANGVATLWVGTSAADIAVRQRQTTGPVPSYYSDVGAAKLGVHAGDIVVLPAACTPRLEVWPTVSFTSTAPIRTLTGYGANDLSFLDYTSGTSWSGAELIDLTLRSGDTYSLFAVGEHEDGTVEVGAAFDLPLDTQSIPLTLHPSAPSPVSITATSVPATMTQGTAWVMGLHGADRLADYGKAALLNGGSGSWSATPGVLGLEYADDLAATIDLTVPSNDRGFRAFGRASSLSAALLDFTNLPPAVSPPVAFDGTSLQWTITQAGVADTGVARLAYSDVEGGIHVYQIQFPPNFCGVGPCTLTLPPSLRTPAPASVGGLGVGFVYRASLTGYSDSHELFFNPRPADDPDITSWAGWRVH